MTGVEPHVPGAPDPAGIRQALRLILSSRCFAEAERLRPLLAWLVDESLKGRSKQIKESIIAFEVFDRGSTWNPQADALVRVNMSNLRKHLERYYDTEGRHDPLHLTIPKGSYAPCFTWNTPVAAPPPENRSSGPSSLKRATVTGLVLVLLAVALIAVRQRRPAPPTRLAVLPFENLSGQPGLDYVPAGLTEELTSILARSPGLTVAATPTRGLPTAQNVSKMARILDVRYLVAGSVRPASGKTLASWSITARLADSTTGSYVWSEHYVRDAANLEALPEEIARAVSSALQPPSP